MKDSPAAGSEAMHSCVLTCFLHSLPRVVSGLVSNCRVAPTTTCGLKQLGSTNNGRFQEAFSACSTAATTDFKPTCMSVVTGKLSPCSSRWYRSAYLGPSSFLFLKCRQFSTRHHSGGSGGSKGSPHLTASSQRFSRSCPNGLLLRSFTSFCERNALSADSRRKPPTSDNARECSAVDASNCTDGNKPLALAMYPSISVGCSSTNIRHVKLAELLMSQSTPRPASGFISV
jgi:hypothetical protein